MVMWRSFLPIFYRFDKRFNRNDGVNGRNGVRSAAFFEERLNFPAHWDAAEMDGGGIIVSTGPIKSLKSRSTKSPRCLENTPLSYSRKPAFRTQSRTAADPSMKSIRRSFPYLYVAGGGDGYKRCKSCKVHDSSTLAIPSVLSCPMILFASRESRISRPSA